MSHPRPRRRLVTTVRALTFLKVNQSTLRQSLALITIGLILLQPTFSLAQRTADLVSGKRPKSSSKALPSANAPATPSAPVTGGNLIVYRVGDGAAALGTTAAAVFLDEYTTAGAFVQTIALPSSGASALTATGNASTEGAIAFSQDKSRIILTGYRKNAGLTNPSSDSYTTTSRVIGTLKTDGTLDTTTTLTSDGGSATANSIRSANSVDGTTAFWVSNSVRVSYNNTPFAAGGTTQIDARNSRQVLVRNNIVYASNGSTAITGKVQHYGTLPTTATAATPVVTLATADAVHGFELFDLNAGVSGPDTLYALSTVEGLLRKYTFNGTSWAASGSVSVGTTTLNLSGTSSGTNVNLYLTNGTTLSTITDTSGYGNNLTGTVTSIATAGTNMAFRGVALAPADSAPSVNSTTPANGASAIAVNQNILVTFSEAVTAPAGAFSISCVSSGAHTFALSGGPTTFTLDPDTDFAPSEQCTVTVDDAQVSDTDTNDPPDTMAADYPFTFTIATPTQTLNIGDVTQIETNAGTTTFNFNVSLTAPAGVGGVTFQVNTQDGSTDPANAGTDYVGITGGSGSITSGNTSTTVSVTVNGDATFEANETFLVNISSITGANAGDTQGLGTITNDDAQPTLTIADVAITEGNAGTQSMTFTVTASGSWQDSLTVNYATADSSATTADNDYVGTSSMLTFVSGDTSETFDVTINGDTNGEGDEMFLVDLSGATGATITDNQALGIIRLDDPLSLAAVNTLFSTNFDVLALAGVSVTTPAAWTRAETGANADNTYTADNGFGNAGNTYSYGTTSASERALGGLQSGSLVPTFGAFFRNDTGVTVTTLLISYTGEQWRIGNNAAARDDRLDFQYSLNATGLTNGTWTDVNTLDFTNPVKTAGAAGPLDGNAAANRTAITNVISGLSIAPGSTFWIRYNDFNASGADDGLAVDDFSITANPVLPDTAPSVTSTSPVDNATFVALSTNISVTFNEAVGAPAGAFSISCTGSGAHGFALSTGDNITFTLDPTSNFSSNEVCTVTVEAAQVTDADTDDPPNNMAADYVFDFTTVDASACGTTFTAIYTIQGSGSSTPIPGAATTEGVVIGDFQGANGLKGFYIQDPTGDANTATSDGIFVFDGNTPAVDVNVGDRVRVSGTVAEAFNNTQITPTGVIICSTGNTLPAPVVYDLPEPVNNDLERVENMLVTFTEALTVTGNFTWGRFGELVLSSDARMYQQNSFDRPNTAGALARASLNLRSYIVLDDGLSIQNPNPIPYQSPDQTRRAGDTVTGLTGVLTFDFSEYRLQPTVAPVFAQANPRPAAPAVVGGTLRVASSNVLNYFNGDGAGGGFPTARGASSPAEFTRQRDKIIAALTTLNADVIGVSEVENDGGGPTSALQDLVNGMNAATAPGTYIGLHSPNPGTDAIQNAIIYKPARVTPVGAQVNDIDPAWGQARAPLAQIFQQNSNGEKFTFIVNHFTSKGCSASDTGIDADLGDGQGCDNGTRQTQANRLLVFIQDRKLAANDPDVLSMGDYNAYGEEDPLFILEQDATDTLADGTGGLISETKQFVAQTDRHSFQFGNQFGELDHAFATKSMNSQVTGATIWHINGDEPVIIDYNQEFKLPSGTSPDLYTPTPYRASDHDPMLVGLNLGPLQLAGSVIISELRFRGPGGSQDEFVELYNNTNSDISVSTNDGSLGWTVVASNGSELCRVDNNTLLPARGHFLCTNSGGYSLADYGGIGAAIGNVAWTGVDIPDSGGVALFRTNNPVNYTLTERLDAVGYAGVNALYREGTGFQTGAPGAEIGGNIEYSFFRSMTRATNGLPKDTGDNTADFMGVCVDITQSTSLGTNLGAPGPENLSSPINRNGQFGAALLDPSVSSTAPPNRVRDFTTVPNGMFGTMIIRRTFTNNTGTPIALLRFRIVEVTTFTTPAVSGRADLRALDSNIRPGGVVVMTTGGPVTVLATTLEEPPTQANGGGWNSSLNVPDISGAPPLVLGSVPLSAPLAPGQSISVEFLLGVQTPGTFLFFVNIEAGTDPCDIFALEPCMITKPMLVKKKI